MVGTFTLYIDAFWSNCWDCGPYVALREKGVPFSTAIALLREGAITPGARRAITGLAPALQHGSFWLAESSAIIEYLEEILPPPEWPALLPAAPQLRARARQLMSWLRCEIDQLRMERDSTLIFYPTADLPPLTPLAARQAERLVEIVLRLEPSPHGALLGDWCIADVDVAFALMRLVRSQHELPAAVRAYAEAVWARPAVREYVEHARPPHPPSPPPR
ncbi:MAG TPA: glutathione transferase [Kofleriaceae bacterium]|nr:glutathione transferase [Kofleriaceae bacterium]